MQRYTIIHPLFMSFFSKSLYRDVAQKWKGLCFTYLISLLALCVIPGVMKFQADLSDFFNNKAPKIVKQVPAITISKGKVSIAASEPYFIRDEKGDPVAIIDTSGKTVSLKDSKALVLLTKTSVVIKKDEKESKTFELAEIDSLFIDRGVIYSWIDTFEQGFAFILYPFALFFSFLFHLAEVFIYAAIGLIFARSLNASLSYRILIRLSVISITPALILGALIVLADISIPYWWLMSFSVSTAYLFFAVRVNSLPADS